MSRHSSIDALRERYQRSRIQPQQQNDNLLGDDTKPSSINSPVATVYEEEEEEEEEEELEDDEVYIEDDDYSMYSSSSSIPDENINFDLVYALHTFVATVDGQASVVKGDAMTLLDDSNSYWWLIRALKASEVGYIPAENIETPFERLARLNKHRNVEVTSLDQLQHYKNTASPKRSHERKKVQVSKALACQVQIILTDQDDESLYEETFEKWQEEMSAESYKGVSTVVDDDSDEDDSEDDEDNDKAKPANASKKDNKKKFTPLLNPDFNRSIHTVTEKAPSLSSSDVDNSASSPVATSPPAPPVHDKLLPLTMITSMEPTPAEKLYATTIPEEQPVIPSTPQQAVVTGLKRLLSIGKKNKPATPEVSMSNSDIVQDTQYHVLRIFAGNINVGALFSTVAVTPEMNADQLLKLALQKFHIPLLDSNSNKSNDGIEYYLTVKSMDSDEITLTPQDKPLAIFESLNDHLTTPMPSLTYIKRLSMEQPTIKVTRVGVSKARQRAKARFGEDSVIRFSLHKRIKRTIETSGQIYVKISYYAENKKHHHHHSVGQSENKNKMSTMGLIRKSSLLRVDQQVQQQQQQQAMQQNANKQERIDKLVAVSIATQISGLKITALEKFHLINQDASQYFMSLSVNGHETPLNPTCTISDALGDPGLIPKLFVLRKRSSPSDVVAQNPSTLDAAESTNNRRFMRFLKQDKDAVASSSSTSSVDSFQSKESTTGTVLRRLDQAIQSLENDKRQLSNTPLQQQQQQQQQQTMRILPARSNSLSAMSSYSKRTNTTSNHIPKTKIEPSMTPTQQFSIDSRKLPTRSSSLKINGDAFDNPHKQSLSNMDDLQLELSRIASSHQNHPSHPKSSAGMSSTREM